MNLLATLKSWLFILRLLIRCMPHFNGTVMIKILNSIRLHLALMLLAGIPESVWIGKFRVAYSTKVRWSAGRLDSRGALQGYELS